MSGEASYATPATAVLALELLFDRVTARFEGETPGRVEAAFGWKESARQTADRPRIVWMPGDPQGGLGALKAPRRPGRTTRPLVTLDELFTVKLWAQDRSAPDSERAQYRAVRLLYDDWMRHVQRVVWALVDDGEAPDGFGGISIISQRWDRKRTESQLGAALWVVGAIPAMVPDDSLEPAPADTEADIDESALDVIEPETFVAESD